MRCLRSTVSAGARNGRLEIQTPPDPRTGATVRIFDLLEWIHAVTAHIPDRGPASGVYYGALSNRARVPIAGLNGESVYFCPFEK